MRLAFAAALLLGAACSSSPDAETSVLDLFDYVRTLRARWDEAYRDRDEARLERHTLELKRLVGANFERVLKQLTSEQSQNRMDAAFALGFSGNPAAVPGLVAATEHAEWEMRHFAISALGMLGLREVPTEPFRKLLADRSSNVRLAALFGLRHLLDRENDRGLLDALHAKLTDPDVNVRNEALIVLRKTARPATVKPILAAPVKDVDWLVRANAALTLEAIGPAAMEATPHLIEMLRDEESKVVGAVWAALKAINDRDFDRSYHTWRDWYEDEQRHYYACLDHKEVSKPLPGECPVAGCGKKLERIAKEPPRKTDASTVAYACPDHAEVRTTTPSFCGKAGCGKPLQPRKPDPVTYVCPDHPEVLTSSPSTCGKPGCGKALVPKSP